MDPRRARSDVEAGWRRGESGSVVHEDRVVHVEHVWGTAISVHIRGTQDRAVEALAAVERCREWFADVDQVFSPVRLDSEVVRSRRSGASVHSAPFVEVVDACALLRAETQGAFDPWSVPGGYDPSGYVKGWAADRAADLLEDCGFTDVLVNAGGDVAARGDEVPGRGTGWPVGIVNPGVPGQVVQVARLRREAMATSARYERGDHVIDPVTGQAALLVDSATVVGPDLGVADALATAALVRGPAAAAWVAARGDAWSLHLVMSGVAYTFGRAFDDPGVSVS